MLNLNGSLTKAGVEYSTLWSESFDDDFFLRHLYRWLTHGTISHRTDHVRPLGTCTLPSQAQRKGRQIAEDLRLRKSIMGIFDEGCMGMYNAIIPDDLLFACGVCKERLSQSALYYATTQVTDREATQTFQWLLRKGMKFHFGAPPASELTKRQVLGQCKMYIAAARLADEFGCRPFDAVERHDADLALLDHGAAGITRRLQADTRRLIVDFEHHGEPPRIDIPSAFTSASLMPQSPPVSILVTGPRQPCCSSKLTRPLIMVLRARPASWDRASCAPRGRLRTVSSAVIVENVAAYFLGEILGGEGMGPGRPHGDVKRLFFAFSPRPRG